MEDKTLRKKLEELLYKYKEELRYNGCMSFIETMNVDYYRGQDSQLEVVVDDLEELLKKE